MTILRILDTAWDAVSAHLNSSPGEHLAFLFARRHATSHGALFVADSALLVREEDVTSCGAESIVAPSVVIEAVNQANASGCCLIEVHNHGGDHPCFSRIDRDGFAEVVPYMLDSLGERPYVALVTGDSEVYGEVFDRGGSRTIARITVVGRRVRSIGCRERSGVELSHFDRQIRWLTPSGQRDLAALHFVIGGAGGTGSHAALGLAFLGARNFVIVDDDLSDHTSLHRLATAKVGDIGKPKAMLAAEAIRAVAPSSHVRVIQSRIQTPEALAAAKMADVLVGCFDNDGARLVWNELAVGYRIPLLDFGVGIRVDATGYVQEAGGRVALVIPGGPCLRCMGQIDRNEAEQLLRTRADVAVRRALGYVNGMQVPEVAVYALNAAVVNIGLNELTVLLSGVRPVALLLDYDLLGSARAAPAQWLGPVTYRRSETCVVCACAGVGDDLALEERYEDCGNALEQA